MRKRALVEQLPIFVYGTLLPGHPNYHRMFNATKFQEAVEVTSLHATVWGYALVADERSWFPYLVQHQDIPVPHRPDHIGTVEGKLLYFTKAQWQTVVERLDALEGVPDHYVREKCWADTDHGGRTRAWVYRFSRENTQALFKSPLCGFSSWADHVRHHKTYEIEE